MSNETLRLGPDEDYIPKEEIEARIQEMGNFYTDYYKGVDEIQLITIMQGAATFAVKLQEAINHPRIRFETLRAKDGNTNDKVRTLYDPDSGYRKISNVLIVDGILHGGKTLSTITRRFKERGLPGQQVDVAVLVENPAGRLVDTQIHAKNLNVGFRIHDVYIVGAGMDDGEGRFRDFGFITKFDQTTRLPLVTKSMLSEQIPS